MTTTAAAPEVAQLKVNEKKWTAPLMKAGWTALPNVIFERQRALGLDAIDVNIILHIASYWWTAEGKPFPSKRTIAAAMDVEPRHRPAADCCHGGCQADPAGRAAQFEHRQHDQHLSSRRAD
ncbi:hypothetical protein [Bradyrhizobium elkanii]